jgi:hypothetical protein
MSKNTREFFEGLKQDKPMGFMEAAKEGVLAVAPGLSNILGDIGAELGRLGVQGQMELASAIFGNGAFVPYGPGQYTPKPEHELEEAKKIEEQSMGREM